MSGRAKALDYSASAILLRLRFRFLLHLLLLLGWRRCLPSLGFKPTFIIPTRQPLLHRRPPLRQRRRHLLHPFWFLGREVRSLLWVLRHIIEQRGQRGAALVSFAATGDAVEVELVGPVEEGG